MAEDSGMRVEEIKSSGGEDPETFSGIERADQSLSYIIHFTNMVELYQMKTQIVFRCGSADHLVKDCPKGLSKTT